MGWGQDRLERPQYSGSPSVPARRVLCVAAPLPAMFKFLLCLCFLFCNDIQPPQVLTNLGYLNGKWMTSRGGNKYLAFYGIPYAKPPLGQLRFKDPVEFGRWEGVRQATEARESCLQWMYIFRENLTTTGSEDCLYLNVYTPDTKYGALLPVIVYFHDGAFEFGSATITKEPDFWMDERVVIVTVAYRLGALGFLSFEDAELPGNMGLKDQLLALKWVRQNAPAFGGHPKRITLMGESAGGASVHYHLLSPRSRASSLSGTALSPWSWLRPGVALRRAQMLAKVTGCERTTTRETIACLRCLPAVNLTDARRRLIDDRKDPIVYYGPVVDQYAAKPFLPKPPHELIQDQVPWLIGVTSGEGLLKTELFTNMPSFGWKDINENFTAYIDGALFNSNPPGRAEKFSSAIKKFYFDDEELSDSSYQNLTNLFSDGLFIYPALQAVKRHHGPSFFYYFDYKGENTLSRFLGSRIVANGSCHIEESIYLWAFKIGLPPLKGDDLIFSRSLVKLWTNFAKYGYPTTKDSIVNWEKFGKNMRYLQMDNGGFALKKDLLSERMNFWMKLNAS